MADNYNSRWTGEQIDEAVRKVIDNSGAWDSAPSTDEVNEAIENALGDVGAILDSINGEVV